MDASQCDRLAVLFAQLGEYYQRPLSDQVIRFYVADLEDLNLRDVLWALHALRREPGRRSCPLPADVRARMHVRGETPEEMAASIMSAVSSVGRNMPQVAQRKLGPVAWEVVVRMGGWSHLCGMLTIDNLTTVRAQCRELCRAQMDRSVRAQQAQALPQPLAQQVPALPARPQLAKQRPRA